MAGDHLDLADPDRVHPLGSPEDTQGDVVKPLARGEQVPALDGPAGDVDKADTFWHVSKFSTHAPLKTEIRAPIAHRFFLNWLDPTSSRGEGCSCGPMWPPCAAYPLLPAL